ncbi:MAG: response regulator [Solirubrobacteraceae bacterium]
MRIVAEAGTADETLAKLESPFDVVIVDYHLGDGRDGLSLTADLKWRRPAAGVLIYSAFADGAVAVSAIIAGADGLLGKHELGQELCGAVRRLARALHHLPRRYRVGYRPDALSAGTKRLSRTGLHGDWVRWVPRSLVLLVLMFLSASMSP